MRANKGIISKLSSLLILRIYNNHNSPRDNKTIIHKIKCLNYTHKLKYRSKESKEFFFFTKSVTQNAHQQDIEINPIRTYTCPAQIKISPMRFHRNFRRFVEKKKYTYIYPRFELTSTWIRDTCTTCTNAQ